MENIYTPNYLKKKIIDDSLICPKCNNKLKIERVLDRSVVIDCEKCYRLGMYNSYNSYNRLKSCNCKTIYIYKKYIKCEYCSKCIKCNKQLEYQKLCTLDEDEIHLCNNCI